MKNTLSILLGMFVFSQSPLMAGNGFSFCDPDSLEDISVSGTVVYDTINNHLLYYLETNGEGGVDYVLNFGPVWYEPTDTNVNRPAEGAVVTIEGGLNVSSPGLPVIIVYAIDGESWRNPWEPFWNHFNNSYTGVQGMPHHGYGPGWLQDSLVWETISGVVLTDSTFIYLRYYLDIDGDDLPDYHLNFGPPWYNPEAGTQHPAAGDQVEIYGAVIDLDWLDVIIVFEIDTQVWRDALGFNSGSFGRWGHSHMNMALNIRDPFMMQNRMMFQNSWHGQGLPPSIFCQLLQVHFQNFPDYQGQQAFAGFEVGCFSQMGAGPVNNLMMQGGLKIRLNNEATLQLHINQYQIDRLAIQDRDRVRLKYWDNDSQAWITADAQVDAQNDIVTFTSPTLYAFYLLVVEGETTPVQDIGNRLDKVVKVFPNPARETVAVEFDPGTNREVSLSVYDQLGRVVVRQHYMLPGEGPQRIPLTTRRWEEDGLYFVHLGFAREHRIIPLMISR